MESEVVKIRTKKGRIITLSVLNKSETHIKGLDLFNQLTIIAFSDIDEMLPIKGDAP